MSYMGIGKNRASKKIGLKKGLRKGVVKIQRPRQCGEQSRVVLSCRMLPNQQSLTGKCAGTFVRNSFSLQQSKQSAAECCAAM